MTSDAVHIEHFGTLDRTGSAPLLRYERRLAHPREKVWSALTEPEHLAVWFPTTIEGEWVAGARLRFSFEQIDIEPMSGEMLRFEPPELLEFSWGPDMLRFELRADGEHTLLELTVALEELGKASRDGAGWHTCLDVLALDLDGETERLDISPRWRQVHPTYVENFGADASTLGPPKEWEDVHGAA
jgi:uncharacterized protein YndB with AHSA1/START domain